MSEFTIEEVKKIPNSSLLNIISKAKNMLKNDKTFEDICKEYDVDTNIINIIPMKFDDLDVSARTSKGVISFNYRLLCDGKTSTIAQYAIHEIVHYFQQVYGDVPTKKKKNEHYLDDKNEVEAFQNQVKFLDGNFGEGKADDYVDQVLDYHDFDGKRRAEKEEELKEKISD